MNNNSNDPRQKNIPLFTPKLMIRYTFFLSLGVHIG